MNRKPRSARLIAGARKFYVDVGGGARRCPGNVLATVPGKQRDGILWWLGQRKLRDNFHVRCAAFRTPIVGLAVIDPLPVAEYQRQSSSRWPMEKGHAPIAGTETVGADNVVVPFVVTVRR